MKIAILGRTGMLGHIVEYMLKSRSVGTYMDINAYGREALVVEPRTLNQIGAKLSILLGFRVDYVINCIGAIKPMFANPIDVPNAIYTNAIFPRQLSTWGTLTNTRVIHITTDCVYDGWRGEYKEGDAHNALDSYGKSKSLGEPDDCMVLRTSIIGPEFGGRTRSLLEWLKSQCGKEINGFTNHVWNGVTTLELGRIIFDIIFDDLYEPSLFHVFSSDVTKFELVSEIIEQYGFDIKVNGHETDVSINRSLRTEMGLNDLVIPQDFEGMIQEMAEYERSMRRI